MAGVKGTFQLKVIGIPEADRKFMLRVAMGFEARHRALTEAGELLVKEMKALAPPYPLSMLKHGKRYWKVHYTLRRSIRYEITGAGITDEDLEVGPHKSMKSYKYFPGDRWLALEYGTPPQPGPRPTSKGFVRAAVYQNVNEIRRINRKHFTQAIIKGSVI